MVPLRSKSQDEVLAAIKSIITPTNSQTRIRTDQGGEFHGNKLKQFFKEKNITHFMTQNSDIKSNYVERFNRTLKKKLFKYMYMFYNQTHKYTDILDDIVKSYNSTVHNSIQMAPKDVKGENEIILWAQKYLKADQTKKKRNKPFFRFNINEFVWINYKTHPFTRDFDQRWTKIVHPQSFFSITWVSTLDGSALDFYVNFHLESLFRSLGLALCLDQHKDKVL